MHDPSRLLVALALLCGGGCTRVLSPAPSARSDADPADTTLPADLAPAADTEPAIDGAVTEQRVTGALALYLCNDGAGNRLHDEMSPPLELVVAEGDQYRWEPGRLLITGGRTLFASEGAASKIISACVASDALTVEAWVSPSPAAQVGPARIASLSASQSLRNFTLGVGDVDVNRPALDAYAARVRNDKSVTINGVPQLTTAPGVVRERVTHVAMVRAVDGRLSLWVDGVRVASVIQPGTLDNWDDGFHLLVGNEQRAERQFTGALHLLAIYDRALDDSEVQQNYRAGADPELTR